MRVVANRTITGSERARTGMRTALMQTVVLKNAVASRRLPACIGLGSGQYTFSSDGATEPRFSMSRSVFRVGGATKLDSSNDEGRTSSVTKHSRCRP